MRSAFFSCMIILAHGIITKKERRKQSPPESDEEEISELEENSDMKSKLSFWVVYNVPGMVLVDFENLYTQKVLTSGLKFQECKDLQGRGNLICLILREAYSEPSVIS